MGVSAKKKMIYRYEKMIISTVSQVGIYKWFSCIHKSFSGLYDNLMFVNAVFANARNWVINARNDL